MENEGGKLLSCRTEEFDWGSDHRAQCYIGLGTFISLLGIKGASMSDSVGKRHEESLPRSKTYGKRCRLQSGSVISV